jgi:hypothetical protein
MSSRLSSQEASAGRFWPNPVQELLLKAALLPGDAAAEAFKKWLALADRDRLDEGSYRLLPLLAHNLESQGISDPFLTLCRGVYRHTWVRNQIQLRQAGELLQALHGEGINAMMLKGGALALAYYANPGLRPFEDIDVLVPTGQAQPAFALLKRLGWSYCRVPLGEITREHAAVNHAVIMVNERGVLIDLHWHLLFGSLDPEADREFWLAAELWRGESALFRILGPTDQLFHACVHGFGHQVGWEHTPPLRWVADAMQILAAQGDRIDYRRLGEQAGQHHLRLALQSTLGYLRDHFAATLPGSFIREMAAWPIPSWEKSEWRSQQKRLGILGALPMTWRHYRRLRHGAANGRAPGNFAIYMRQRYNLRRRDILPFILKKGIKNIARLYNGKEKGSGD